MSDIADFITMIDEMTIADNRHEADTLDALRNRLDRNSLSTDEWNALVGAAYRARVEARQRENTIEWRTAKANIANQLLAAFDYKCDSTDQADVLHRAAYCLNKTVHLDTLITVIAESRARWCSGKHIAYEDVEARLTMPSIRYEAMSILAFLSIQGIIPNDDSADPTPTGTPG